MSGRRGLLGPLRRALRGLAPYVAGNRRRTVGVALTGLASGLLEAALLYLVVATATGLTSDSDRSALDIRFLPLDGADTDQILLVAFGVLAVLVLVTVVNGFLVSNLQTSTLNRARNESLGSYLRSTWATQSREPEGQLVQTLTSWVLQVGVGSLQLASGLTAAMSFAAYLITAFAMDTAAAAAVVVTVALVGFLLLPVARLTRRLAARQVALGRSYGQRVAQAVRMSREIVVFDVGDQVFQDAKALARQSEEAGRKTRILVRLTPSAYQYIALLIVLVGLSVVDTASRSDLATAGTIVLLMVRSLSYGQVIVTSVQRLVEIAPSVQRVRDAHELYAAHVADREGVELTDIGTIEVDHVSFSYDDGRPVLEDVSLTVERRESVGVIGPSGAGKSTLFQLLLRLHRPSAGAIRIGDVDLSSVATESLRRHVAVVPQQNHLLLGTVADNIRFFRPATLDSVEAAARAAHLHDDIVQMPDGYDTVVGPGERELSGGQVQRLAFARALLGDPSILLLDEPTSALDMRSEELMQATLRELKGRLTVVVIAHRMSTLSMCDRIAVLEAGRLVAMGTHEELAADQGFYLDSLALAGIDAVGHSAGDP